MTPPAFADRAAMFAALAAEVAATLSGAVSARGRASLAVPGGTTPEPFLDLLSQADLPWDRIAVMLTDERFVGEDSPRSNTALLRRRLLRNRAAAARLVPLTGPGDSPEHVLPGLQGGVLDVLPLDAVVLGMGGDLHTASLFPGADRLAFALTPDAPPLVALRAPGAPEARITLSAPVLTGARARWLLITGAEKRAALTRAEGPGPVAEAPVRLILHAGARIFYAP